MTGVGFASFDEYHAALELLHFATRPGNPVRLAGRPGLGDWSAELTVRRGMVAIGVGRDPMAALLDLAGHVRHVLAQPVGGDR